MNAEVIIELEKKVGEAISLIARLREEKEKLEGENQSLKHELENIRKKLEEYGRQRKKDNSESAEGMSGPEGRDIKKRLRNLAVKLAALEDSWN